MNDLRALETLKDHVEEDCPICRGRKFFMEGDSPGEATRVTCETCEGEDGDGDDNTDAEGE